MPLDRGAVSLLVSGDGRFLLSRNVLDVDRGKTAQVFRIGLVLFCQQLELALFEELARFLLSASLFGSLGDLGGQAFFFLLCKVCFVFISLRVLLMLYIVKTSFFPISSHLISSQ